MTLTPRERQLLRLPPAGRQQAPGSYEDVCAKAVALGVPLDLIIEPGPWYPSSTQGKDDAAI